MSRTTAFTARVALLFALTFPLAGFVSVEALFAPKAELWPRWQSHDAQSEDRIDHAAWERIVMRYLSADPGGLNRFAYGAVMAEDRQALQDYIDALAALPISRFNREEQQAYWLNLYNALTVKLILQHYPLDSIRDIDISPGLFADGPWDKPLVTIEGEDVTLNDIEHRILRPIWNDARVHYAVNCASVGCPNLQIEAFTADNTEMLLEAGARDYVNNPRGVQIRDGKLVVSSIYIWFKEDFGGSDASVIAHLKRYADEDLSEALAAVTSIDDHAYDWQLNDSPGVGG